MRPQWFGALLTAMVVVLAACGGGGGDDEAGEPVEIAITVTETGVDAPPRPRIPVGSPVSVQIESFEPDNAHLHGYDLWTTVGPDGENRIDFVADQPGIFLLELEADLLYLTELVVE